MKTILMREVRLNLKNLLIWSFVVGGIGMICILLYKSMEGDMKEMADAFSNMGAFADAFGMSTLSIATFKGFFATEVGTVHSLGSGMFAALIAVCILSKEEEGHTGEFLLSLPVSRTSVVAAKGLCVAVMLVVFTLFCSLLYWVGILIVGDEMPVAGFLEFMGKQCLMDLEIGAVCFAVSSLSWKNRTGLGLGIAVLFYFYDIIGRVVPDLKDALFIGPYSFANASEILSGKETEPAAIITSLAVTAVCTVFAFLCYNKRDIAS